MKRIKLARALAAGVVTVAVLNTLAALSMPVREWKAGLPLVLAWLVLLVVHAGVYEFGDRIRGRFGVNVYAGFQAAVLFAIALARPPAPLTIVLYMAAVAELVTLAGSVWGTGRVRGMVLRQVGGMVLVGAVIGLAGAVGRGEAAGSLLFASRARTPWCSRSPWRCC